MAMFGKQQYTATAAYDEKKDSSSKKKDKGLLNMPISTNIQISKKDKNMKAQEQSQNGFDPFDPFDPFPIRVGERVQVDEEGHIVSFGEEEKKEEPVVEAKPTAVPSSFDNPWDNIQVGAPAPVEVQVAQTAPAQAAPITNTVVKAEKPEITADMLSQLANEIAPKMSKSLVEDITKEVTAKLSSQISQSIPTGSGDVKVIEPKITADALSEVVKQVTDSVSKTINAQVSAEISKQLGSVSTSVSSVDKNVQNMASTFSSSVEQKLSAVNSDLSSKIASTNERMVAIAQNLSASNNNEEMFNKMGSVISSLNNQVSSMSNQISSMGGQITTVKDILEKPMNLTDAERDAKLKEAIETERNQMYRGVLVPVLLSVVEARENMLRMAQVYKEKGTDVPSGVMKGYGLDLGDALEKNKVEIYQSKKGDKFDPKIHKKIGTAVATKEDQDGLIANSLSCGYSFNGEVIFQEKVDVYVFKK